jgi:hypothetical protein
MQAAAANKTHSWAKGSQSASLILPGEPIIKIQKNKEAEHIKNPLGGYFCVTTVPFPSEPQGSRTDRANACLLIINLGT